MCTRSMAAGPEGDCGCKADREEKALHNEDLLTHLKEYKNRLEAELITINSKLKAADNAGKGGE